MLKVGNTKRPRLSREVGSFCGADGGNRTPDPLVRSQMLYPLSYVRVFAGLGYPNS